MNQVVIFSEDGKSVEVCLGGETVWFSKEQMALLFGRESSLITKHLRHVFTEWRLERDAGCTKFPHTTADGQTCQVPYYSLD